MSLEIRTLTHDETRQMLESSNNCDRISVLKRTNGQLTFEKLARPVTVGDFEQAD